MGNTQVRPQGRVLSVRRALISCIVGLVIGGLVSVFEGPELFLLAAWAGAATFALIWVWRISWPQDYRGTEFLAEEEGRTHSTDSGVLLAAVASLGAVVFALIRTRDGRDAVAVAVTVLSVYTVLASWALVNTVFALKYARLYYLDEDRGINFKQDRPPAYSDFAYMAFTIGMSYAVSDCEPTSTRIRKVALGHALLSYAFGTGVIAMAINLVANLGQGA